MFENTGHPHCEKLLLAPGRWKSGQLLNTPQWTSSSTAKSHLAPSVKSAKVKEPWFKPQGISPESAAPTGLFPLSLFDIGTLDTNLKMQKWFFSVSVCRFFVKHPQFLLPN